MRHKSRIDQIETAMAAFIVVIEKTALRSISFEVHLSPESRI